MRTPLAPRGKASRLLCACALALALPHAVRAQSAFQPGLRWRAAPNAALPTIPRSLAFTADGNFVWTAANGPYTRLQLFAAHADGLVAAPLADLTQPGALGALCVAGSDAQDALYALVQMPAPDSTHRATIVSRYSALAAASTGVLSTVWTFDSLLRANGPARLACSANGGRVFVANWNGPTPEMRIDVLDGATGAPLASTMLFAAALNEMCVSADGTRAAIVAGQSLWFIDGNATPVYQEALPLATSAVSLSGDGAVCAVGGARVRVLAQGAQAYATRFDVFGNPGEVATRVALSRDASTLAIGWWNATTGVTVRFEIIDAASGTRIFQRTLAGAPGGLQNAPEIVRISADGSRAALGAWGDGVSTPEMLLWDRAGNAIVLEADLAGSVFALDLDAGGRRLALGVKGAHANQFAASGEFRLHDTAEAETVVLNAPRVGGVMHVAARSPGAVAVAFLSGQRAPTPVALAGVGGTLALNRATMIVQRRAPDAAGEATLSVAIPNDPALIGTYRHLQTAFFVNGAWTIGPTVLDLIVY
ncbi:MAG: hypothetical protein JNL28_00045 [Planctomycetes bacterium]|nr:hypothetical protein [Planctomycetota bacterium]